MVRLVVFILIFVIFLGFIVLNLHHTSDLSFGFITLKDVPVFVSVLCSFMLGMLFSIPMAFALIWKRRTAAKQKKEEMLAEKQVPDKPAMIDHSVTAEIVKDKSSYGID